GLPRDYAAAHPSRPALMVEVAQSGLRLARGRKAAAYARAGIADYWIVNLGGRVLEVYREAARRGPAAGGWARSDTTPAAAGGRARTPASSAPRCRAH